MTRIGKRLATQPTRFARRAGMASRQLVLWRWGFALLQWGRQKCFFRGKTSRVLHRLVLFQAAFLGVCEQAVVQNLGSFAKSVRLKLAKPRKRQEAITSYEAAGLRPARDQGANPRTPILRVVKALAG